MNKDKTYNRNRIFVNAVMILLLSAITGCNSMVSVAPSTTPITANDSYTKLGPTQGNSFGMIILWFLPLCEPNPSQIARDAAIQRGGGNALVEVVEQTSTITLLALTLRWITVEGTAVQVEHRGKEIE